MKTSMQERVCVITGATSGIGRCCAFELARRGAVLALVCRNPGKSKILSERITAETGNRNIRCFTADLVSQDQVRRAAEQLLDSYAHIHVLINNAGIMPARRKLTRDGFESMFAVNYLSVFTLTRLLLERLKQSAPARIICVSSDAHRFAEFDPDDLNFEKRKFSMIKGYGASKLYLVMWARMLAGNLSGSGVTVNCLHPGFVDTRIGTDDGMMQKLFALITRPFKITPEQGGRYLVHLASAPELESVSGTYWAKDKQTDPSPAAQDPQAQERLWRISETLFETGSAARGGRQGSFDDLKK